MQSATDHPAPVESQEAETRLHIAVVFTSAESTVSAMKRAGALAASLGARITLLVPQVVPYPLPLECPPVSLAWSESRCLELALSCQVETTVRIYLCRDRLRALAEALKPASIVVLGCRKRWWPASESRLARKLERFGHEVILTEAE